MRVTILALFLSAGTAAICQLGALAPANPISPFSPPQTTPMFNRPGTDLSKLPPSWDVKSAPPRYFFQWRKKPARPRDNAHIDSQMIVHPPQWRLGMQPQGTFVARNEYPDLQFLPIDSPARKLQEIPTPWPQLKLQSIPTAWPNVKLLPVGISETKGTRR
jgi:hypothetical protein